MNRLERFERIQELEAELEKLRAEQLEEQSTLIKINGKRCAVVRKYLIRKQYIKGGGKGSRIGGGHPDRVPVIEVVEK